VTNAAICSRVTKSDGLYVVAVVPLVNPEKNASAIAQKKMLLGDTSVNGIVVLAPPQVPVVACSRVDAAVSTAMVAVIATAR
jgi:hypothetical protein